MLAPLLPPATAGFFVVGVATIQVAGYALITGRLNLTAFHRNIRFFIVIGLLIAVSTNINYVAVTYIDPGIASMLSKTSVIFGLGFGLIWLRERLSLRESAGALITIAGIFIITFQPGDYLRLGSLLVLVSTLMYTLHAAIVKRHSGTIDFIDFFLFRLLTTSGFLLLLAAGQNQLVWPDPRAWIVLLIAGTVDITISRAIYYVVLRRLRISLHQLIMTLSPVIAVGWSLLLFGHVPNIQEVMGGLTVIAGIAFISFHQAQRTVSTDLTQHSSDS